MSIDEYNGRGVEDDRIVQAAKRIVRQYHLEQTDRSEDSASAVARVRPADAEPDNLHALRLALDDMSVKIEQMQRLMVNREALFMATLERIERNLAKTDGLLDSLSADVARIDSQRTIALESDAEDRRGEVIVMMREFSGMMALSRALIDEVKILHETEIAGTPEGVQDRVGSH